MSAMDIAAVFSGILVATASAVAVCEYRLGRKVGRRAGYAEGHADGFVDGFDDAMARMSRMSGRELAALQTCVKAYQAGRERR